MSQNAAPTPEAITRSLPGLPRGPLSPQQRGSAIKQAQDHSEQRVRLGHQLLGAAEARMAQQRDLLQEIQHEHEKLRNQVNSDLVTSFHAYGQKLGEVDQQIASTLHQMAQKLEHLHQQWVSTQQRITEMTRSGKEASKQEDMVSIGPEPPTELGKLPFTDAADADAEEDSRWDDPVADAFEDNPKNAVRRTSDDAGDKKPDQV